MKTTEPGCLVSQLYIETEGSLKEVAEETVRHETIGKWDRPSKPTELFRKSGGYLLDYEEHSPGKGKVAFALENNHVVHAIQKFRPEMFFQLGQHRLFHCRARHLCKQTQSVGD